MDCLKSYEDVAMWFARAKNKTNGRPLNNFLRVTQDGSRNFVFNVAVYRDMPPLGRLTPYNVFEFTLDNPKWISNSLSMALHRVLPLMWERKAKDLWRVGCLTGPYGTAASYRDWRDNACEYFPGIKFDLTDGKCLNPRTPLLERVVPEVRTQWLRDLRWYKRQVLLRVKLGVYDNLFNNPDLWYRYAGQTGYGPLAREELMQAIIQDMKNREVNLDTIKKFLYINVPIRRSGSVTFKEEFRSYLASNSIPLRKLYGVFDELETDR